MKKRGKAILLVLLGLCVLGWFGAANPFNLFVRKSPHFSMEAFRGIRPGSSIDDAISLLGEPIVVRKSLGSNCEGCTAYHFLGDPPPWLLSFQEAWLLVDAHGRVVTVIVNSEP